MTGLNLAFVSGLSDKKLAQKLVPLQAMPEISRIDLYRREPFYGKKVYWRKIPQLCSRFAPFGDAWRLVTLMKQTPCHDVLIGCHQRFHGIYAALAGALWRKPVIQLTITDPAWIERTFLGRWALLQSSAIGFRGHITLERFHRKHGNKKPCFVPPNVCEMQNRIAHTDKKIDLLYVGYLAGYKNIPGWLQTAAEIKRRRGALTAVLIGEKPNWRIRALVKRLGLTRNLEFTGALHGDELNERYSQARVLLLTSFWEGLPMVALEAMNAGVPVVATNVGDVSELVKNGKNGYLTDVGDICGATHAVEQLLAHRKLREKMSVQARKSAQDFLSKCTLKCAVSEWRSAFLQIGLI